MNLIEECNNLAELKSPSFHSENSTSLKNKVSQFDNFILRKECITYRIELIDQVLQRFQAVTYLLNSEQRLILNVNISTNSFSEASKMLNDEYFISESKYRYSLNEICLKLSDFIDYKDPPSLEKINHQFELYLKNEKYVAIV